MYPRRTAPEVPQIFLQAFPWEAQIGSYFQHLPFFHKISAGRRSLPERFRAVLRAERHALPFPDEAPAEGVCFPFRALLAGDGDIGDRFGGEFPLAFERDKNALEADRKADGGDMPAEIVGQIVVSSAAQNGRADLLDQPGKTIPE